MSATVFERIHQRLSSDGDTPFLIEDGTTISRAEFLSRVGASHGAKVGKGLQPGQRVLVSSGLGTRFWIEATSLWRAGAVFVPVASDASESDLSVIVKRTQAHWSIGLDRDIGVPRLDADIDGQAHPSPVSVSERDAGAILFTSGSTGRPKGVVLSHAALAGNADGILQCIDLTPADRLFMAIPFHFTSAICHFLACALSGASLAATERRLYLADLATAVRRSEATCFGGSPLQIRWIAECARQDPVHLRWIMSSGDKLSTDVIEAVRQVLPDSRIYTVYGLTEVGGRFCCLPPDLLDSHAGSVGRPIPGMGVTLRDETLRPVQAGEDGEVFADGAYLFDGYVNDPEATDEALTEYGFRSGDLGRIDDQGYLWLTGRADDVFKVGGQKVSVIPIVDALMKTGMFEDVAVIPFERDGFGQAPYAFYVPKTTDEINTGQIMRRLRETLPASHLPVRLERVSEVPRTGSGKVRRAALRERLGGGAGSTV